MAFLPSWEAPNLFLMYRTYKYHKLLKRFFPQYVTDGLHNIWIVKPCYNARGFGVHCVDSTKEILANGKKP